MTAEQEVKKVYPDVYLAQSDGIDNMPNDIKFTASKQAAKNEVSIETMSFNTE